MEAQNGGLVNVLFRKWCSGFMLVSWGCMNPPWLFWTHQLSKQLRHGTHLSVGSPRARAPRDLPLEENFPSLSWVLHGGGAVGCGGLQQWKQFKSTTYINYKPIIVHHSLPSKDFVQRFWCWTLRDCSYNPHFFDLAITQNQGHSQKFVRNGTMSKPFGCAIIVLKLTKYCRFQN